MNQPEQTSPGRAIPQADKRYRVNPDFVLREIAGEYILVPVGDAAEAANRIIALNETCGFLWQQFRTPRTVPEVLAAARQAYSDSTGQMEQHIRDCVAQFVSINLIEED